MADPLQELADSLCRRFCSWSLQHDKRTLSRLGSGTLEVDLLTKTCRFGRELVAPLLIVERLHHQLRTGLTVNGIELDTIRSATLSIVLEVSERHEQKDSSVMWFGKHDGFTGCQMEIRGRIRTASADYESTHRAYCEWPL